MIKKLFGRLLDYVAYVILAMFGLIIAKMLYLVSFTEMGSMILISFTSLFILIWAFTRSFPSKRG